MKTLTKEEMEFFETATEKQLRYLLKNAKDEKVRLKAFEHYNFKNATEFQLSDLLEYAKDEQVRHEAKKELERRDKNNAIFKSLKNK